MYVLYILTYLVYVLVNQKDITATSLCMNLHGSPQCHGWLLLTDIRVPRLLTVHERGTMQDYSMHYGEAMNAKHTAPMETQIMKE